MLYWTCPECGRECSPAVRDCPVCPPVSARKPELADATPQLAKTNGGILALAHNLETIHAVPILTSAPEHAVQTSENGRSNHAPAGTLVEDAPADHAREVSARFFVEDAATPAQQAMLVLAEETLAIPVQQTVDSLVRPLVESAGLDARPEPPAPAQQQAANADEPEAQETSPAAAAVTDLEPVHETAAAEPDVTIVLTQVPTEPAAASESVAESEQSTRAEDTSGTVDPVASIVGAPENQDTALVAPAVPEPEPVREMAAATPEPQVEPHSETAAEIEQLPRAEESSGAVGEREVPEVASVAAPVPEPETVPEIAAASEPEIEPLSAAVPEPLAPQAELHPETAAEIEQHPKAEESSSAVGVLEPNSDTAESQMRGEDPAKTEATAVGEREVLEAACVAAPVPEPELVPETAAAAEPEVAPLCAATPEPQSELHSEPIADIDQPSKTEELSEAIVAADQPEPIAVPVAAAEPESKIQPAPVPEPMIAPELAISETIATIDQEAAPAVEPEFVLEPCLQSELAAAIETQGNESVSVTEPEVLTASEAQLTLELEQTSRAEGSDLSAGNQRVESPVASAVEELAADPVQTAAAREICGALELEAEALVEAIGVELETERAAVSAVALSFQQQSSTVLLAAPTEIVTAPAPPIFEWLRSPRPRLESLAPPPANLAALSARPQPPTLAGPCLSRELRNHADSEIPKRSHKSSRLPGWVTSSIVATLLLLLAWTLLQYFSPQSDARASTPAGSQTASTSAAAAQSEALAKSLEISGLRLVTSWSGKQQIRFLLVNHAPQELSGVTAQVTVKAEGSPILLIQAPIRSLGPNQSKEIRTDLDSDVPASVLSDWQSLRAEVHLTKD